MSVDHRMRFTLRPETPQEKRVKDGYRAKAKAARANARFNKRISPKKTAAEMKPDDWRGFQAFWRSLDQLLFAGLTEDELQRVWQVAWTFHHAVAYTDAWSKVLTALKERQRAAAPPEPPGYWKRGVSYDSECAARRDGW
jgi:hypothetical protein